MAGRQRVRVIRSKGGKTGMGKGGLSQAKDGD